MQCVTHDDDGAGDGDGGHHAVGDGVFFVGVADALVVTVDAPLVGLEHNGHDEEGQRRWQQTGRRRVWKKNKKKKQTMLI